MLKIEKGDVKKDESQKGDLNVTSVDAIRIAYDLMGRGILTEKHMNFLKKKTGITQIIKPILHANQYFHLLKWLKENGQLTEKEYKEAEKIMTEEQYTGI